MTVARSVTNEDHSYRDPRADIPEDENRELSVTSDGSEVPSPEGHRYLSTACLHLRHDYCSSMIGLAGTKRPAQCKFCDAYCRCDCHTGATP